MPDISPSPLPPTYADKIWALLRSRRFAAAVAGLLVVIAHDLFGISEEQATLIVGLLMAWITGDSISKTGGRRFIYQPLLLLALLPALAYAQPSSAIRIGSAVISAPKFENFLGATDDGYDIRFPASTTWAGKASVLVTVDAAGKTTVQIDKSKPIYLSAPTTTTPQDPTIPTDPDTFAGKLQTVVAQIDDPETARSLAVGYSVIILQNYEDIGSIAADTRAVGSKFFTDKWDPFRKLIADEFTARAQDGRLTTAEQYAQLLTTVRDSLLTAGEGAAALDLGGILDLIQEVIAVLADGDKLTLRDVLRIAIQILTMFGARG